MAFVALGGGGIPFFFVDSILIESVQADNVLSAAGHESFIIGHAILPGGPGTSKTISAAGGGILHTAVGASAVFANAGTTLRIGIQDITGATGLNDGTFDVSADLVGGTDTITSSAVLSTPMESGSKTITYGDLIAIGGEFISRAGADTIRFRGQTNNAGETTLPYGAADAGSLAKTRRPSPQATIEFDDGTFGWVGTDLFAYLINNTAVVFQVGSTPDEYALIFQFPFDCTLRGVKIRATGIAAADDFECILYSDPLGTPSAMDTITQDATLTSAVDTTYWYEGDFSAIQSIAANTDYAISLRPTTANTMGYINYLEFTDGALRAPGRFGTTWRLGTRSNQTGAFTEDLTIIPPFGPVVYEIDTSGGGGGNAVQLVNGGLVS